VVATKVHGKVGKRYPVTANRALACVSSMFTFGEKHDLLPPGHVNQTKGIEKFAETARERYLSIEELERLGAAIREAETVGVPWDVDETKSTAKHVPKRDRETVIRRCDQALAFYRLQVARNPGPQVVRSRFRSGHAASRR